MNPSEKTPNPSHGKDLSDLIELLERNPEVVKQLKDRINTGLVVDPETPSPVPAGPPEELPPAPVPKPSPQSPEPHPAPATRQPPTPRAAHAQPRPAAAPRKATKAAEPINSPINLKRAAVPPPPEIVDSAQTDTTAPLPAVPAKLTIWQKLGGGSLTLAILIHVVILILAAVWIIQVIQPPQKKVDFMPSGGGGGERGAQYKVQQKKLAQITPSTNVKRVFAEGATSNYAIPEPGDSFGEMSSLNSPTGGGMSGGLGGSGLGSGFGKGSGSGAGSALGGAGAGKLFGPLNLFGQRGGSGLVGTFYDLKQNHDRTPTGVNQGNYTGIVRSWVDGGMQDGVLDKYYRAPDQLSALQFMMPKMPADEAPKAFNVEKEVKPALWVAHYKGKVSPPKSGTYYFVGAADDVLMVRFDGKLVLDGSWEQTSQLTPGSVYKTDYGSHPKGGFIKGEAIQVTAGKYYDIDVVIGERPGGYFWSCLLIEEEGERYRKNRDDMPLFPLFRLSSGRLPPTKSSNQPPFDAKGPVWKLQGADPHIDPFN